jgi:hypothetical protein
MGGVKCAQNLSENLKGKDYLENLIVDGSVILKLILGKEGVKVWNGLSWLRIGSCGGLYEHSNQPSASITINFSRPCPMELCSLGR